MLCCEATGCAPVTSLNVPPDTACAIVFSPSKTRHGGIYISAQSHWSLHPRIVTTDRLPGVTDAVARQMDMQDKFDTAVRHYDRLLMRLPFGALKVCRRSHSTGVVAPACTHSPPTSPWPQIQWMRAKGLVGEGALATETAASPVPSHASPGTPAPPRVARQSSLSLGEFVSGSSDTIVRATSPTHPSGSAATSPVPQSAVAGRALRHRVATGLLPGRAGLRNLGNTCYINSVMQALSCIPVIRDFFLYDFVPTFRMKDTGELSLDNHSEELLHARNDANTAVHKAGPPGHRGKGKGKGNGKAKRGAKQGAATPVLSGGEDGSTHGEGGAGQGAGAGSGANSDANADVDGDIAPPPMLRRQFTVEVYSEVRRCFQ